MNRIALLLTAAFFLAMSAPARVEAQAVDGTWKLTYLGNSATSEVAALLINLKTVDGKLSATVIGSRMTAKKETSIGLEGNILHFRNASGGLPIDFQAEIPKAPTKRWLGGYAIGKTVYPAWLSAVAEAKAKPFLDRLNEKSTHVCPPMQEALALQNRALELSRKRGKGFDLIELTAEEKKKAKEAHEFARKETPRLYREVLKKFPDDPAIFEAILGLMRSAEASKATLNDVKAWGAMAEKHTKAYGPRFERWFILEAATALADQEAFANLAVEYARRAVQALPPKTLAQERIEALDVLAQALRKDAQGVDARIESLEEALDREYLASLPTVKKPFAGRKGKSNRAVVLEKFLESSRPPHRGAQSEHVTDMLLKTYKPSELILLQYFLSNSNSREALTNPDAQARRRDFVKAFPTELRFQRIGITGFNGFPKNVLAKTTDAMYEAYRAIIDPLLEENANVSLDAKAMRKDGKIDIQVNVSNLATPSPDKKLRIVLAEEMVRYTGNYGDSPIRLHEHVVRACPGGAAGIPLTEANTKYSVSVNIDKLRDQVKKRLDEARSTNRSVKVPAARVSLEHLLVVAFVQDDNTRKILQAVQVEVK